MSIDPIESHRRRRRINKRGSARDFFCPVIHEQVLIALRRRTGALRWQDSYVWCSQDQCQYSGSNEPPCPLHPRLLALAEPDSTPIHCARCRLPIAADTRDVVIRADNAIEHAYCPYPLCARCTRPIFPDDATLADAISPMHARCTPSSPAIGGGSSMPPWAAIFEMRLVARAHTSYGIHQELRTTIGEVVARARDTRARARQVRTTTARLLGCATV